MESKWRNLSRLILTAVDSAPLLTETDQSSRSWPGMRVFVAGKLVQRSWQDNDGNKRQTVEIQVTHVGPDLQFATGEVAKSTAEGSKSTSDGPLAASSVEDEQTS